MITLVQLKQDIQNELAKVEKLAGDDLAYLKAKIAAVFAHPDIIAATPATLTVETKTYSDGTSVTGVPPLPAQSPAQQAAALEPVVLQSAPLHVEVKAPLSNGGQDDAPIVSNAQS
jgi:hypothetical protein